MKDCLVHATPFTPTKRRAAEQTYLELEDFIRKQVWSVIKAYGGDFEDAMAEANYLFLEAYAEYDGSVPFMAWVRNWIRWTLIDELRVRLNRQARYTHVDEETLPRTYRDWTSQHLTEDLSTDAAMVVKLVLETPGDLAKIIAGKGGQPRNYRSTLRTYLSGLGWTAKQIAEAFTEIGRALSE